MLPLLALLSSLQLSPAIMNKPTVGVQQPIAIGSFPPTRVEQPADDPILNVCTINFVEEVSQHSTGKEPQMILAYAADQHLTSKQTQQVREYCKAYSAGAAFVVASVVMDATINDILARSKIPVISAKGHKK